MDYRPFFPLLVQILIFLHTTHSIWIPGIVRKTSQWASVWLGQHAGKFEIQFKLAWVSIEKPAFNPWLPLFPPTRLVARTKIELHFAPFLYYQLIHILHIGCIYRGAFFFSAYRALTSRTCISHLCMNDIGSRSHNVCIASKTNFQVIATALNSAKGSLAGSIAFWADTNSSKNCK